MNKIFKILIILILLPVFGCNNQVASKNKKISDHGADTFSNGSYTVSITYPIEELTFGSSFDIILKLNYPIGENYILLPPKTQDIEKYSNTVINSINEGEPSVKSSGITETEIVFNIEAWLPGEVFFPSLTILFPKEIRTDELVFKVVSAFKEEDTNKQLSQIISPEQELSKNNIIKITASAGLALIIILLIIFLIKRKKQAKNRKKAKKTQEEMLEDFKKKYIDTIEEINFRTAFFAITDIFPKIGEPDLMEIIEKAKFSRDGLTPQEGQLVLNELYQRAISLQATQKEAEK